jgi:predicted nucleotidyltransferase
MELRDLQLPSNHRKVIDRFMAVCQADERVFAAFLGGSYTRASADAYSDLDLGLITADEAYQDFLAGRAAFVRQLGEPLLVEDFDNPHNLFCIFADGTECELAVGRAGQFTHIHAGPYQVVLDKNGILAGAVFPGNLPARAEQVETLRRLIYWFWHDLSHFITAMGRGQLWWASGQLEVLRRICVNLARLKHNFAVAAEDYEKLDQALPVERLSPLETTFCPHERAAIFRAARIIIRFYQDLAPILADTHGIPYPDRLERLMLGQLDELSTPAQD